MNFTRLCSLLRYLYAPENLTGAGVENPHQFDHQPAAIARAWQALVEREKAGIVLADEVGLGKTFEALGVMYFYLLHRLCRERRDEFRALIVLPPRLILKWTDELERFAKQVQQLEPQLSEKERPAARAIERDLPIARELTVQRETSKIIAGDMHLGPTSSGVFLVRETLLSDLMGIQSKGSLATQKEFAKLTWDIVIADEAHNYARGDINRGSQRSQAVHALSDRVRRVGAKIVLCTATPFQLDTSELVNLLSLIEHRASSLENIHRAIDDYNEAIVNVRRALSDEPAPQAAILEDFRQRASEAKNQIELVLRPYVLRSRRPEREGRETRERISKPIPAGENFPWLYWQVKDWTRELSRAGDMRMRTFLPTTLQAALSSTHALRDHLRNKEVPIRSAAADIRKRLQARLKDPALVHPKFKELQDFITQRIEDAAHNFTGSLDDLGRYKSVVFVNHIPTIRALIQATGGSTDLAQLLSNAVRSRTNEVLQQAGITPDAFRKQVQTTARQAIADLQQEYDFALKQVPSIWHTPYVSQLDSEYQHLRRVGWGTVDDFSAVEASELHLRSISQEFAKNIRRKLQEPLAEYELASGVRAADAGSSDEWKHALEHQVSMWIRRRAEKSLDTIRKLYYGSDDKPDQPREWLRFRLSRFVYAFSARDVVEDLSGTVDFATRQQVIDSFNNDLYPLILICSPVAEEGIDLQKRCNTVIHYDLEWNPAKVEQREGRVDRLGRQSDDQVQVTTFKLTDTYDERILARCESRRLWMDLYLCSRWREESEQLEEETTHKADSGSLVNNPAWLSKYRLDLRPEPLRELDLAD